MLVKILLPRNISFTMYTVTYALLDLNISSGVPNTRQSLVARSKVDTLNSHLITVLDEVSGNNTITKRSSLYFYDDPVDTVLKIFLGFRKEECRHF